MNDNICCYMSKDGIWVKGFYFFVRYWINICIYIFLGKNKKSMKNIYVIMCKKKNIVNDYDFYIMYGVVFIEVFRVIFYSYCWNLWFFYLLYCLKVM